MSTKENVVFTAAVGEELLTLMEQQVFKGRRGVRGGFKDEAYVAVANTMTETSHGAYVLTAESIRNRSEYLKKEFDAVTGLFKASGFRFNRATKRVVASEEVWRNWLEGHPDAGPWRSKTVDYEQLSLVFDINVAMGQYSRCSQCKNKPLNKDLEKKPVHLDMSKSSDADNTSHCCSIHQHDMFSIVNTAAQYISMDVIKVLLSSASRLFMGSNCNYATVLWLMVQDIQFSLGISKKSPPPQPNKNKNVKSSGDKYNPQAKGGTKLLKVERSIWDLRSPWWYITIIEKIAPLQ